MAYGTIPNYASAVTPALIVGTVAVTVVAAPGAGKVLRVSSCIVSIGRTAAAGALVDLFLNSGAGNILLFGGISLGGTSCIVYVPPEPGILWPINDRIEFSAASTVAGGLARCTVTYYTDFIT